MNERPERPAEPPVKVNSSRRRLSLLVLLAACAGFILVCVSGSSVSALPTEPQAASTDFSRFLHTNQNHARLPCLLCHRRESNAPEPKRSGHVPCAGCHAQQFADSGSPICTICHTSVGAGSPPVRPFPNLKSFNVTFDHAKHNGAGCATCHKPAARGVALSIPSGLNAHTTCYRCHVPRAQSNGRDISSCGICHQAGQYTRTAIFTKAYRTSFSHAKHGAGQKLACNDCHSVRAGQAQSKQVTAIDVNQHFGSSRGASCSTCHNGKRAFGGDDFSSCKRCHQGPSFRF